MEKISKVSLLKVGKVQTTKLQNQKRDEIITAMKKVPVEIAYLEKTGFSEDEVADKVHHGGEEKAIFFMSSLTYQKLSKELNVDLAYQNEAPLGENILVENLEEKDVCVGDIWQIGEALVQISQPRQPCWKLSVSTNIKQMTKFVFQNGLTGWYGRVLKEGKIEKNDDIVLNSSPFKELNILDLNLAMVNPKKHINLIKKALNTDVLGKPFKEALEKRYKQTDKNQFAYQEQ